MTEGLFCRTLVPISNDSGSGVYMTLPPNRSSVIDNHYTPSDSEEFMNSRQQEYFRRKLLDWKSQLIQESLGTIYSLQQESHAEPDVVDSAANETDRTLELRARDRARKLIQKIDEAVARIDDGSYGFCEETGEPIGLKRLEARPIATLCIEAQERHEKMERVHRDD